MLDSLEGSASQNTITITVSSDNQKKAQYAREGSSNRAKREFLKLGSAEKDALTQLIKNEITKG